MESRDQLRHAHLAGKPGKLTSTHQFLFKYIIIVF